MQLTTNEKNKILRDRRYVRLRILNCFYNHSSLFIHNRYKKKFSEDEIELVQSWTSFEDCILWMKEESIVSHEYSYANMKLDFWYINKQYSPKYGKKAIETGGVGAEKLLLHVVIQALLDVYSNRPCDLAIWGKDLSPDSMYCTTTTHICSDHAEKFLRNLHPEFESFIGVSVGCIYELLFQIKKDPACS